MNPDKSKHVTLPSIDEDALQSTIDQDPMMSAIEGRLQNLCDQIDTHFGVSDEELRQIFDSDSLESLEHELIGLARFAIVAKNEHREKPELLRQLDDRIDSVRSSVHALRMESLQRVEERHKRQRRRRGG